jgi:SAM-dependent methyltransferase
MSANKSVTASEEISNAEGWRRFYHKKHSGRFPTEWVVRTLAGGNYPGLKIDKSKYQGKRILDLSCGDGRNLPLLLHLGFEVHATEISEPIIADLQQVAHDQEWNVSFKSGRNTSLPYPDGYFDYILSCSSFYYLEADTAWEQVMREVARVVRPDGIFVANLPDPHNAVLSGAETLPDGSMMIRNDPFKLRNGLRFMVARSQDEVGRLLSPWFAPLGVGYQSDDFYGLKVSAYFFAAQRTG